MSEGRAHVAVCAQPATDEKKEPRAANETTGKWFPSVVSADELDQLVEEKSMTADLVCPPPPPRDGEHVLHQEYFGRGLGFPLHNFVRGLLHFFWLLAASHPAQWSPSHSQLHHLLRMLPRNGSALRAIPLFLPGSGLVEWRGRLRPQ